MDKVNEIATRLGIPVEKAQEVYQVGFGDGRNVAIKDVRPRAGDIVLTRGLYEQAYAKGMSLSGYLEELDPDDGYRDGLDAFERQLKLAGIRTRSLPYTGIWANRVERFWNSDKPGAECLLPEFMARVWRKAALGANEYGERFYASSNPVSDVLEPAYLQREVRAKQIAPAIPLAAIVAITTPIDQGVYEAFYLTDSETDRQMRRVTEGAEIPTATLTGGDHTIRVKKYGRRLLASYETIKRMTIDRFALHLSLLAVQAEKDKVATGLDVLLNGDGNSGTTPTNSNLTTLDSSAVAGTLTLKGYLAWRMLWENPYICNVVLARKAYALQAQLLNTGSANVPFFMLAGNFGIGGFRPINTGQEAVGLGWTDSVTDTYLLGIDNRFALEMVMEIGTNLTETDKIISRQMNEITMTESLAFCIMDANCVRTLAVNA